ncbi:unnamed protein product [Pipistrellus nathusii]|uniref:Transposase n=1 Tax=Pipistrellus nathusii TaxID=59473 RepID=A0ABP0A3I5_PIPNA
MGYGSRRPAQTPLLSAVTKIKHLQFTEEHKDWTVDHREKKSMEHLWDEVKRATRQLVPQPSNLTELDSAIYQAWCQIPYITFQHLMESMPRRITTVLKAKGGPMKSLWGDHNKLATQCVH